MSEEMLVRHCSPTLAGMKTGNLFACEFSNELALKEYVRYYNRILGGKGLRILPIRFQNGRALIYVYRPSRLTADLRQELAEKLLREKGYCTESPERCVVQLIDRLGSYNEFPHEIGLFLGYPPEDVYGFMEDRSKDCKCIGCWKVYGDVKTAQRTFAKYKKCTDVYCRQYANGKSIERLTVAG